MKPLHFALIGEEIGYSRSPEIFAAIAGQLGREIKFDLHSVSSGQLRECLGQMIREGVIGFGVTIPHKQALISCLESVDDSARAIGALNSVTVAEGILRGYNTDYYGFSFALNRLGFKGCDQAMILGSGGSARAIIYSLAQDFGVRRFEVFGRDRDKLIDLKRHFSQYVQAIDITTVAGLFRNVEDAQRTLLVNCTPLGGPRFADTSPLPTGFRWRSVELYFDLNYNADNSALASARQAGIRAADGSAMLVAQGAKSFELWTGMKVEFDPIYRQVFSDR